MSLELTATVFVTLFVVIDPVGLAPLFVALTRGMDKAQRQAIAGRAIAIAFGLLALFGAAGDTLLGAVGIGIPAFRIAGGLLLFLMAVEMLFEKRQPRREKNVHEAETLPDPTVFPLATPLIAGPGALATMILLVGQHPGNLGAQATIYGAMILVLAICWLFFWLGAAMLGPTGINVVTRLLGMLLAALAVQFVLQGLRDFGFGG